MLSLILVILVAAIHLYFLYLEMFRWEAPRTQRIFGLTPELAAQTRAMAANQGFYNGIVGIGLYVAVFTLNGPMVIYLLCAVVLAGLYAVYWGIRPALYVQSLPAALALVALWIGI